MKRKIYTQEEKEKAVKLAEEIGIKEAAEKLGMTGRSIYAWRSALNKPKPVKKKSAVPTKQVIEKPVAQKSPEPEAPQEYNRGDIYYISEAPVTGHEYYSGRPAVIVSNNTLNKNLGTLEVVFLTTKVLHKGPKYTIIQSSGRASRVICSNIATIDKSRTGDYIGKCTPEELSRIDQCLAAALSLDTFNLDSGDQKATIYELKAERDAYEKMYMKLLERFFQQCK